MSDAVKVGFVPFSAAARGILVVFCDEGLKFGAATRKALGKSADLVKRAATTNQFKGKSGSSLDILEPEGIKIQRLIVLGTGKAQDLKESDFLKFGGLLAGKLNSNSEAVTVIAELPDGAMQPAQAAAIASGARLRAYKFDRYKTKKKDGDDRTLHTELSLAVDDVAAARKAFAPDAHIVDGVVLARELVNEPPNVLYPEEFARRAGQLKKLGVDVEILDTKAMAKLGMGALLGVAQGSARPGRTVIMRWNGGKKGDQPVAFIGKGVCFDTGGISIKPAGSMEDMKGDMGGAACVVGLMHALASRKARANVIGAIGLVENMPDGNAQRPGDIVTSMSGQTIEIINTDAEGRLVLADVLWYVAKKFKPKFMVDLATLTGEIDHEFRLELLGDVPKHVREHQSALGIGVDDFDGLAGHRRHDIAGTLGIAIRHVFDEADRTDHIGLGLARRQRLHQPDDTGSAAHVALHVFHTAGRLDRNAAGVEADALADEGHRLVAALAAVPAHDHGATGL